MGGDRYDRKLLGRGLRTRGMGHPCEGLCVRNQARRNMEWPIALVWNPSIVSGIAGRSLRHAQINQDVTKRSGEIMVDLSTWAKRPERFA